MTFAEIPLKRLVDATRPITYGIVQAGPDTPGGVLYIRPVDMTSHAGVLDTSRLLRTTHDIAHSYRRSRIRRGDVVVSIGPSFGKVMVVPKELDGANLTQGTARVAPKADVNARFIYWSLQSKRALTYWESTVGGATFRALNLEPLSRTPMPLATLDEQRRIADFLDAETARIDKLNAARSRHLELLEELSAAHVMSAFKFDSSVPKVRLGYLATVQTGVTVDASRSPEEDVVTLPYLRVANVQAGYLDLDAVSEITVPRRLAAASTLQAGDVLMTEGGDIDKLGRGTVWEGQIGRCLHQNHVFAVRVSKRLLDPHYLALLTRTAAARIHFESTGNKTTNLASTSSSKIRDLRVPLPSLSQQRGVVMEVNGTMAAIEAVSSAVQRQRRLLAERRQALITAAVTGQLDVTTARGATLP